MSRGPTEKVLVDRFHDGARARRQDEVIVEEPLEIRLDEHRVATTMRTPGHDFELAAGFLHAEGLLGSTSIRTIRYCGTGAPAESEFNVVTVDTVDPRPDAPPARLGNVSSSCGLCGSIAIDDLWERLRPLADPPRLPLAVVATIGDEVVRRQDLFGRTGGLHAAAAFAGDGHIVVVREDIGRHNAVDKVAGRLLLDGALPATGLGLFVSGRASFEMVQKAWAAGFGTLVAVSAPSALAIEAARRAGMTLVGFARDDVVNLYAGELVSNGTGRDPAARP
jgi:FdhD protein